MNSPSCSNSSSPQSSILGLLCLLSRTRTPAADMPNQVPDDIKRRRLEEIMLAQQQSAFAKNAQRIGDNLTCLVDSVDNQCCKAATAARPPI